MRSSRARCVYLLFFDHRIVDGPRGGVAYVLVRVKEVSGRIIPPGW